MEFPSTDDVRGGYDCGTAQNPHQFIDGHCGICHEKGPTMRDKATPRTIRYFGSTNAPSYLGETWLESETACYPDGGMTRRCLARHPDGKLRVVRCGIPDSAFTIPVRGGGYVSVVDEREYVFHPLAENRHKYFKAKQTVHRTGFRSFDLRHYPVRCKNVSMYGADANTGNLIAFKEKYMDGTDSTVYGRVLGVVDAPAIGDIVAVHEKLLVLQLSGDLSTCYERWVDPDNVTVIRGNIGQKFLAKFFQSDPLTIDDMKLAADGYFSASHMDRDPL